MESGAAWSGDLIDLAATLNRTDYNLRQGEEHYGATEPRDAEPCHCLVGDVAGRTSMLSAVSGGPSSGKASMLFLATSPRTASWRTSPSFPITAVYVGKEGAREIDRHFQEMWGEFVQEPVEFIDAGGDLVVAVIAMRGRGKGSGTPVDAQAVWVHELRAGKPIRMRAFTTKAQALEAAGLSE